ncbi:collectin-11 [Biomphalaria pfeifferi]|uniref:Collectin-11 n=1 Tax=Biomphalaria pfeifferi TaxID=112525 RepID=A0AAD8BNW0_BIOPF|nr:collectin-11 [Biomphalaria pfeifferi]
MISVMTYQKYVRISLVALVWCPLLDAGLISRATPTAIEIGVTETLMIECLFTPGNDTKLTYASSIKLFHSESTAYAKYIDILTVLNVNNVLGKAKDSADVKTEGSIDHTNLSVLRITWKGPTAKNSGSYKCVAHGVDENGNPDTVQSETVVTAKDADIEKVVDHVNHLNQQVDQLQKELNATEAKNNQLEKEKKKQQQNLIDAQNALFTPSPAFNGSRYLLTKTEGAMNYFNSVLTCGRLGGYLAEIDSEEEYKFVLDSLLKSSSYESVLISGTDEAVDKVWVHSFSKNNVTFFKWASYRPDSRELFNCLAYRKQLQWHNVEMDCKTLCTFDGTIAFLCEVPDKNYEIIGKQH